jgi:hypothetical protein
VRYSMDLKRVLCVLVMVALGCLCACDTGPSSQPEDRWTDFSFEYYHQGNYNAFPNDLSDVQGSYDSPKITLQRWEVQMPLTPERIRADDANLTAYMQRYYRTDSLQHQNHARRHVFAIEALLNPITGATIKNLGVTLSRSDPDLDWASFVAVHTAESLYTTHNVDHIVSFTTTHELCHLIAGASIIDCRYSPDSHDGVCLMMDVGEKFNMTLFVGCVDTEYPFTKQFCDSCVTNLKAVKYNLRKL